MKNFDPQNKIFDQREKIIDPLGHKSKKTLNPWDSWGRENQQDLADS